MHDDREAMATSYDEPKTWHGRSYTGMKVGRTHTWDYEGRWKERKLGPDLWEVSFRARKTRKGKGAPEGTGAPVGTEYLWFFAPTSQSARKLDANTYETHMEGLKWKIGFRPATSASWDFQWSKTGQTARQRAIRILTQTLADLKADERLGIPDLDAPTLETERPTPPKRARKRASPTQKASQPARAAATQRAGPTGRTKKASPPGSTARTRAAGRAKGAA